MLSKIPAKILVIVDEKPKVELSAEVGLTPDGKQVRLESEDADVVDVLHAVAAAKHRVAVAAELIGSVFYSHSYSTAISRRALQPLIAGCRLRAPGAKGAN